VVVLEAAGLAAGLAGNLGFSLVPWSWIRASQIDARGEFEWSGLSWAVSTLGSSLVEVSLLCLILRLRRGGGIGDYLALHSVRETLLGRWLLVLLVFAVVCDSATWLSGRPIVPDVMVYAYQSAGAPLLLWLAMLVAAPMSEEMVFRGFLFRGLAASRLGPLGSIVLTSALWSGLHLQYDLHGMAIIFLAGLLLGYARWRSDSLIPCLWMHGLMNLLAMAQAALVVHLLH